MTLKFQSSINGTVSADGAPITRFTLERLSKTLQITKNNNVATKGSILRNSIGIVTVRPNKLTPAWNLN